MDRMSATLEILLRRFPGTTGMAGALYAVAAAAAAGAGGREAWWCEAAWTSVRSWCASEVRTGVIVWLSPTRFRSSIAWCLACRLQGSLFWWHWRVGCDKCQMQHNPGQTLQLALVLVVCVPKFGWMLFQAGQWLLRYECSVATCYTVAEWVPSHFKAIVRHVPSKSGCLLSWNLYCAFHACSSSTGESS